MSSTLSSLCHRCSRERERERGTERQKERNDYSTRKKGIVYYVSNESRNLQTTILKKLFVKKMLINTYLELMPTFKKKKRNLKQFKKQRESVVVVVVGGDDDDDDDDDDAVVVGCR
jgi:hypothetical protein